MELEGKKALKNTVMLYFMNIAKMVFPLITLPYLTRIFSLETYAIVTYEKAIMQYVQLTLIFGFTLSATKDIVNCSGNKKKIGDIVGGVLQAKLILSVLLVLILVIISLYIDILKENYIFTALSFINIFITEMLADFLFRALDKMEIITIRFVVSKMFSTLSTFIFIKNDSDLLMIPVLDIIGSLIAFVLVYHEINKMGISINLVKLRKVFIYLKDSFIYFISDMSTTAFGALNTLIVGSFLTEIDISYWGLSMQIISAIQSMYSPIINGIYPSMIRTKSWGFLKNIIKAFLPIIIVGCFICIKFSDIFMLLIGGKQYVGAGDVFKYLVPVLLFSFPSMIYGWPALGSIGKQKETTFTTVFTAILQVIGILFMIIFNKLTLINIAISRVLTECVMMLMRVGLCCKYKSEFNK